MAKKYNKKQEKKMMMDGTVHAHKAHCAITNAYQKKLLFQEEELCSKTVLVLKKEKTEDSKFSKVFQKKN